MGISGLGGGGALPPNIVEQLMNAERIPVQQMQNRKAKSENRLKLIGELETGLSGIKGSLSSIVAKGGFSDVQVVSGNDSVISGVADPDQAVTGSWNIEVLKMSGKPSALTNGVPDKDETKIGAGYIKFNLDNAGEEVEKEIYVSEEGSTLEGIARTINRSGIGIKASIMNDRDDLDEPFRLVLSGDNMGKENGVGFPTMYFLDGEHDLYFEEERESKNGLVKIDGFEFGTNSNKIEDLIPGVTLDIKKSAPGQVINLTVKEDHEKVSGKLEEFVSSVNKVLGFIQGQNRLNEKSDTSATLGGDSILRSVESRIRQFLQGTQVGIKGKIKRLSQLGVEFNRSGTLEFKKDKFNKALAESPKDVSAFLKGDGLTVGVIPGVKRLVGAFLDGGFGAVSSRKRSINSKISRIDKNISRKERQLEGKEKVLRRKFARLEEVVGGLKAQGNALAGIGK